MGLSASQARLLSITARLSDNELKSQQISNSKVRLADRTREASADYIAALDASKLMYSTYDAEGNAQKIDLSAAALYNYSPYKNQYTLVNTSNQILVSSLEAANFVETKNLYEFLDRYGLVDTVAMKELTANREAALIRQENLEGMKNLYNAYSEDTNPQKTPENLEEKFKEKGYTTTDANGQVILNEDAQYYVNLAKYNKDLATYNDDLKKHREELSKYETMLGLYNANSKNPENLASEFNNAEYTTTDADGNKILNDDAQYYVNLAKYNRDQDIDLLYDLNKADPMTLLSDYINAGYVERDVQSGEIKFNDYDNAEYYYNLAKYNESESRYEKIMLSCDNVDTGILFNDLVAKPDAVAGGCYKEAMDGDVGCYKHLIAHLLDWDGTNKYSALTYASSIGKTTDFTGVNGGYMHLEAKNNYDKFKIIIDSINLTEYRLCNGNDAIDGNTENLLAKENVSDKDRLMSDFYFIADKNGKNYDDEGYEKTYAVKSVKQKLIDTLFLLQNQDNSDYELTVEEMKKLLKDLTEGDLSVIRLDKPSEKKGFTKPTTNVPKKPVFEKEKPVFTGKEPVVPTVAKDIIIINDQAKGQWYANLWYAMNGSDTANVVSTLSGDDFYKELTTAKYSILAADKISEAGNYVVFDENLYKSAEWLQFALEQGIVTIQKATVYDPSEDNGKVLSASGEGIMWSRTPYTSCTDFVEVDDEVAIARAEAEYNQKLNDIQAQDKKLDNDLKKLDTEHNALQTEYESVKSVVNKNIERSFKAFS